MENNNIEVMETVENVEVVEDAKKGNVFKKLGTGIMTGVKSTGKFIKNHIGGVVTVGVVIIGGVVYYLIKNGAGEESIVDVDGESVTITDVEPDNIVEFDKAVNE